MEVTQCDAPQRSTLATCIGVQADACGHGKLGGLLSGKLGDNRFLVRIVPRSVGRHLIPPSSSLATMSPTSSPAPPAPGAPPSSPLAPNSAALELARHDHDSVVGVLLTLPLFVRARAPGLVRKQRTQRLPRRPVQVPDPPRIAAHREAAAISEARYGHESPPGLSSFCATCAMNPLPRASFCDMNS